jgi:exosome complex RNA-binding protein Csl4
MSLYEVHITYDMSQDTETATKATAVAQELHWKTSEIARDPVLGDATYFYLTTHGDDYGTVMSRMLKASESLKSRGVSVVRLKIEQILFDTKVGIGIIPKEPAPTGG